MKRLIIIILVILSGCSIKENNNENNVIESKNHQEMKYIFEEPLQGSFLDVEDSIVYFYDTILQIKPFSYELSRENIEKNIFIPDSVSKIYFSEDYMEGYIVTYYLKNSYIIVFENMEDNKCYQVDFDIFDKGIELRNGLKIGLSRDSFNVIYPESKKYNNFLIMGIRDESEFSGVDCYFKNDTIYKITFWDVEGIDVSKVGIVPHDRK